uniref:Uncharacterized protein n=1 Tax=Monodelphis domestica TaxID=13616 RepID=K7E1L9_MONDO
MFIQGLSLIIPLWSVCFVKESFCFCAKPTWARVGWEIFPGEVDLKHLTSAQTSSMHDFLSKWRQNSWSCTQVSSVLVEILFIILTVLSGHYLWTKRKKHPRKPEDRMSSSYDQQNQSIYDIDQILCRLMSTTSLLTRYLKHVSEHPPKKFRHRRKSRKKRDGGDMLNWDLHMCTHGDSNPSSIDNIDGDY